MADNCKSRIHVGDRVYWAGSWGLKHYELATITRIELVTPPQKDCGESVESAELTKDRSIVVDLDNGHWAYGFQLLIP